jgi:hypothetical protein
MLTRGETARMPTDVVRLMHAQLPPRPSTTPAGPPLRREQRDEDVEAYVARSAVRPYITDTTRSERMRVRSGTCWPTRSPSWTRSTSSGSVLPSWTRSAAGSTRSSWVTAAIATTPCIGFRALLRHGVEHLTDRPQARIDAGLAAGDPSWEHTVAWQCYQQLRSFCHDRSPAEPRRCVEVGQHLGLPGA